MSLLTISDLTIRIAGRTLLDHADLAIEAGQPRRAGGAQRGGEDLAVAGDFR
ncbi:MAG: hypothetical protein WDN04_02155 [Rhodospirillales bacterium]